MAVSIERDDERGVLRSMEHKVAGRIDELIVWTPDAAAAAAQRGTVKFILRETSPNQGAVWNHAEGTEDGKTLVTYSIEWDPRGTTEETYSQEALTRAVGMVGAAVAHLKKMAEEEQLQLKQSA